MPRRHEAAALLLTLALLLPVLAACGGGGGGGGGDGDGKKDEGFRVLETDPHDNEYAVARYYRQAKILQIVEGTSEVMRLIIGRVLTGRVGRT